MEGQLATYLAHRMPNASEVSVDELARIYGGSSQETFRFRARYRRDGETVEQRLILRRAPPSGLVVAARDLEYTLYTALAGQGLPIPAAYFLELDPAWLERPFFIMDLAPGKPGVFHDPDPYEGRGEAVARQFWRHLGTLARLKPQALGLDGLRNTGVSEGVWACELDHWEAMIDAGEAVVEPILRGALRWLRRHPPPDPVRLAIVHGDFRSGNFLFTREAGITALLDWEMCHLGDPLEDIAWALDPMWSMERHLPLDETLAIWEAASGLSIDREALGWWRLFAPLKACAIWTTAEASFATGGSREMLVAVTALRANHFHRKEILNQMAARGAMG